ncbi:cell envelope integrity protein TolA [Halotalea alkalilenta]|uniref:cell envelope integrity protein TolA n=1 Tax=Halotalea alkalilenta TaxID=376489 RepID=UPI0004855CAD|nr:cell envelope integrity protein TolA [Halotalea alkalilenta]
MSRQSQEAKFKLPVILAVLLHLGLVAALLIRWPSSTPENQSSSIVHATLISTETATDQAQQLRDSQQGAPRQSAPQQDDVQREAQQQAAAQAAQEQAQREAAEQAQREAAEQAAAAAAERQQEAERQQAAAEAAAQAAQREEAQRQQAEAQRAAREQAAREQAAAEQAAAEKAAAEKAAAEKAAAEKAAAEKAAAEKAAAEKAAAEKAAAEKAAAEKAAAEKAARERAEQRRLAEAAAAASESDLAQAIGSEEQSIANARQSAEASNSMMNIIRHAVEQSWIKPAGSPPGLVATVRVRLLPATGELVGATLQSSSGNASFDNSAIQAVQRAAPFRELSQLPSAAQQQFRSFVLTFNPEDVR